MTNEPMTITVSSDALAHAEKWMRERDELLTASNIVSVVETEEQLQESGKIQTAISKHIKALKTERERHTRPIDKIKKEIMQQEKDLGRELNNELARLKKVNSDFATRNAMDAEAARKRQEEEQRRRAMEAAEANAKAEEVFGASADMQLAKPVPVDPITEKIKTDANRMVKRWSWTVTDISKVPPEFLSVDDKKIRAWVKYQESMERPPEAPGLNFTFTMSVEAK